MIYVYRPEKLNADMQNGKNKKFLNSIGYRGTTNDELINELSARVYSCGGFPHEIGLFLGYPIDDVISFIENKGKNFKCCGCWKVYHDEDNAKKTFEKYKKCTNIYCKKYLQEKGNVLEGIEAQPRLFLKEKDQPFFHKYIQNIQLDALGQLDPALLDPKQSCISRKTALCFARVLLKCSAMTMIG